MAPTGVPTSRAGAVASALASKDGTACWEAVISEVGELVSPVVAPTCVPASSAGAPSASISGDGASRCISAIAEVVSSVAEPITGAALAAGAANDVPAGCEADSCGIDDVVSPVGPLTGGVVPGLKVASAYEECGLESPRLTDNEEPASEGLGLGIGIAYLAREKGVSVLAGLNGNKEAATDGLGLGSGIANAGGDRAVLVGVATRCAG
jgi:hypothetical protein